MAKRLISVDSVDMQLPPEVRAASAANLVDTATVEGAALDATYGRPQRFYAGHYGTLAALFAARQAYAGPAVIELDGLTTYSAANLRIDRPDTVIQGNAATISLPAGADQDALRIGPDAIRLRLRDFNVAGNYMTQTGTSRGIVFESYTGAEFRYADRTVVEDVNVDGFLTDGVVIQEKRLHVVLNRTFIRDSGRYGLDMNSSDCRFTDGAIGGIRGQYGVRVNAGANWIVNNGIYSNTVAGVLLTDKANGCKIMDNDLDNNLGGGLRAVGVASSSLDTTIVGNHFRGNSTSGVGLHSDIYLEQVSNITLASNRAYAQLGSTARTKYVVDAGAGVDSIQETGNVFATAYPTLGRWSATAALARKNRMYSFELLLDGFGDVQFRRQGAGAEVNADFTSLGTLLAPRVSATGTAGQGFVQVVEQSSDPGVPSANAARLFARDDGSGKTQLCIRFATGVVQVISTEP